MSNFDENFNLVFLALLIILFGMPHGALDTLFAKELFNLGQLKKWPKFIFYYLMVSLVIVTFWLIAPTLFLLCFLMISIAHFADDLVAGTPKLSRTLYGGIIIFLPAILHANDLARLYAYLVDIEQAKRIVTVSHYIAFLWLAGLLVVLYQLSRSNIVSCLEISGIIMLAIFTPPLVAFTVYFCAMHSLRHLLRSLNFLTYTSKITVFTALIIPTLMVVVVMYIIWINSTPLLLDANLIKLVFVTLAALTVPHMMLLEKSGFSSWIKNN
ncbi:MAG: Brp/Blh family beta-carotene 15,15'-dioxygenase [Bdellovibrio sp.]|nr:Brp/Blh family beta-carotene 15,15'-dioxygenase [Methylotenera sp.]